MWGLGSREEEEGRRRKGGGGREEEEGRRRANEGGGEGVLGGRLLKDEEATPLSKRCRSRGKAVVNEQFFGRS